MAADPVTATHPLRGRPRDPARAAAILDAAHRLLGELGYERMSIDAIAARAGVSKPTIYRRWPGGKPEVTVAAMHAHHSAATVVPDTGTLRGDLLAVLRQIHEGLRQNAGLAAGLATQLRTDPELARLFREHVVGLQRDRFDDLLQRAIARGELRAERPVTPLFADVGPSLLYGRVLLSGEPVDDAFFVELVDRVLLPILNTPTPTES